MPPDPAIEPVERRKEDRISVGHRPLQIDPCDGREPIGCLVWDISIRGARLIVVDNVPLPPEVSVLIGNVTHRARIVWRKDSQIGIEFLEEPA